MGKKGVPHRKFSKEEKLKIIKEHLEKHLFRRFKARLFQNVSREFSYRSRLPDFEQLFDTELFEQHFEHTCCNRCLLRFVVAETAIQCFP